MPALINGVAQAKPKIGGKVHNAFLAGQKIWVEEEKEEEITALYQFSFIVDSGPDAAFILPTSAGATSIAYNWKIDWGDGSAEQTVSGTSISTNNVGIGHSFPLADTEYIITIRPVTPAVGWLRSFGFWTTAGTGSLDPANKAKLLRITVHPTLMAFLQSSTVTGTHCLGSTFAGCTRLSNTLKEDIEGAETLITINDSFRRNQYNGCTSLTKATVEAIPPNVTGIGTYFRGSQYLNCIALRTPAREMMPPNWVASVVSNNFRREQYSGCEALSVGSYIHDYRISVSSLLNATGTIISMFYLATARPDPDTLPRYYLDATQTATAPVSNLAPTAGKTYVRNRTGIEGYDSLPANWR